jgi:hypothetical protein
MVVCRLPSAFMLLLLTTRPCPIHAGLSQSFYDFLAACTKVCILLQIHGGVESPRGGDS